MRLTKSEAVRLQLWKDAGRFDLWDVAYKGLTTMFAVADGHVAKAVGESLIKQVDPYGATVGWRVAGTDRSATFKSKDGALALIAKAAIGEHPEVIKSAKRLLALMRDVVPDRELDPQRQAMLRTLLDERQWRDDMDKYGAHRALAHALAEETDGVLGTFVNSGTVANLDDPTANKDPELARRTKKSIRIDGTWAAAPVKKSRGTRFI
jgi:hypothetical protein